MFRIWDFLSKRRIFLRRLLLQGRGRLARKRGTLKSRKLIQAALTQFVRRSAQADTAAIETFDVQTPYLALGFEVGDIVKTNPDDRDIFSSRSDSRSTSVIESVRMDFRKQSTQLKVVGSRKVDG